jgi:hypothetical protein
LASTKSTNTPRICCGIKNLDTPNRKRKLMTDPVWSVNIMFALGMIGVSWVIYYILILSTEE